MPELTEQRLAELERISKQIVEEDNWVHYDSAETVLELIAEIRRLQYVNGRLVKLLELAEQAGAAIDELGEALGTEEKVES